jgi:hypothetical protein
MTMNPSGRRALSSFIGDALGAVELRRTLFQQGKTNLLLVSRVQMTL